MIMNPGETPIVIGGVMTNRTIRWCGKPTNDTLRKVLEKGLMDASSHHVSVWPAFSSESFSGGRLLMSRYEMKTLIFLWFTPQDLFNPGAYPQLLKMFMQVIDPENPLAMRRQMAFDTALDLSKNILRMHDFDETILDIARKSTQMLDAERVSLFLINESGSAMDTFVCVRRNDNDEVVKDPWIHISVPKGRGIVWRSIRDGHPIVVTDVRAHPDFYAEADLQTGYNTRNLLCVPLFYEPGKPIGVLELLNKMEGEFNSEDAELATVFAALAAPIVRLAQVYQELETSRAQLEMANRLLEAQLQANAAEIQKLRLQLEIQKEQGQRPTQYYRLIGQSPPMLKVYELIEHVKDTDVPVLITGESGTGKELVARSIHEASNRKNHRFIAVNCAAIPETLMERELFGAERGAFTGAASTTRGLFEAADGGTLFLDEIGEMPMSMQAKLLRVIEDREVRRLGSIINQHVNVRILAASNKDLLESVHAGRFREDLYYRLNVFQINLPPLRERKEDIPLLIDYFLRQLVEEFNLPEVYVDPDVIRIMMDFDWPGNVRQLENEIRRSVILGKGRITPSILSMEIVRVIQGTSFAESMRPEFFIPLRKDEDYLIENVEKNLLIRALQRMQGNKAQTARILGISRRTLYDKMERYNIRVEDIT